MPLPWRDNLHAVIKKFVPEFKDGIPGVVIDAIDAAYVQGIQDMMAENKPNIEDILNLNK